MGLQPSCYAYGPQRASLQARLCTDCPEVVDPLLHRKYRSIVGCLSYLVNMTRPDLAFSFSQLSKFLQYPCEAHLAAAYRVLAYVKGTLHQGLSWHDPGAGSRNKFSGWVDSDFASDIDTRKSMTGYLMVLNVSYPKEPPERQSLQLRCTLGAIQ